MKKDFTEFNVVVRSKENPEAARQMLAEYINPTYPNCLNEANLDFIAKQDYITAVPIEIALTVLDRKAILDKNPKLQFIVTGVTEADAKTLADKYGYAVLEPAPEEPVEEAVSEKDDDVLKLGDTINFGDKTYTVKELGEIVANHEKAKKQVAEMKKRFDADPFFKDFFKDGLFNYHIF